MNSLIQQSQNTGVITLKEITDLITTEHNKAMKIVEKLSLESSFGSVEKTATPTYNPNGSFNRNIDTYLLTKKQAIAVGAKLNNSLLMKVIDRLEELELQNKPKTQLDLIIQSAQIMQEIQNVQEKQNQRLEHIESNFRIENWQQKKLEDVKNFKVYELAKLHSFENDQAMLKKCHSRVWKKLKNKFSIPRYNELPVCEFENGVSFIQRLTFADLF